MKILWSSNSPFCTTGYGTQTNTMARRLKDAGHDVAIFCFFGLEGSCIDWNGITLYPNNPRDWGQKHHKMFYDDFNADIYLTLVDVWVMKQGLDPAIKWVPWTPIDHDPAPPLVLETLKTSVPLVRPIAMSKFGYKQMTDNDISAFYIPHGVNTELYRPDKELRDNARKAYGWEDKFIVGTIATNHTERKNWTAMMRAMIIFSESHPGEVVWYCHTNPIDERGINLLQMRDKLGFEKGTMVFPSRVQMNVGIESNAMVNAYNAMDVYLMPSKGEGFGIPIMEAQSCGVPVIVADNTAQTELVGGGWLVKNQTPQFTAQGSWQFDANVEEILAHLEAAYHAKKNGSIVEQQEAARNKALEYDEQLLFENLWVPTLAQIEKDIKAPKNMEGIQGWRLVFIPKTPVSPGKVIDIGAGVTQPYRKALEPLGEYVGIDTRGGADNVVADACNLPYEDGEFGFAWMSEILEHIDNPKKALAEAKRVAKHGVCIFNTPANPGFHIDPDHKVVEGVDYTPMSTGDGMIAW